MSKEAEAATQLAEVDKLIEGHVEELPRNMYIDITRAHVNLRMGKPDIALELVGPALKIARQMYGS